MIADEKKNYNQASDRKCDSSRCGEIRTYSRTQYFGIAQGATWKTVQKCIPRESIFPNDRLRNASFEVSKVKIAIMIFI